MKVFIILTVIVAISRAHHTPQHRTIEDDLPEDQETTDIPTGEPDEPKPAETSRHHAPQTPIPAQGFTLVPYPALRAKPVYYHQPIQYVPVYQEYPSARQGIGGGLQANLGPLNAGVGAGVGTGGLGGGFNLGLGSLGGINANAGFTPTVGILTNNPGYTRYYNRYYTQPTKYYTTKPTRYVAVESTATPAEYPVHQLASSSPAVATPFARSQARELLIPMYY